MSKGEKIKIAIVSPQYMWYPNEPGPSRFFYIAKLLSEKNFDVEVITGSFEHFTKSQRDKKAIADGNYPFRTVIIDIPDYKKNIDLKREWSYHVFTKKVKKYLQEHPKYDVIYCSVPPNNMSASLAKYCKKNDIPLIADIEDLWPEGMKSRIHIPILGNFIFYPYHYCAEKTYKYITAAVGTSEEYTNRSTKHNGRNILKKTVYVGCDIDEFDKEVSQNIKEIKKEEEEFWISYAGSIASSYDIKNLVDLGLLIQKSGHEKTKIKVLGTGQLKDEVEQYAMKNGCKNIEFLGYVAHPKMAAVLKKSDILINSFAKGVPQSIVNKVGDYLAAGKPMLNTLENEEFCGLLNKYEFGINVEAENPQKLFEAYLKIKSDEQMQKKMSENARKLAEDKFDRKHAYLQIVEMINDCLV